MPDAAAPESQPAHAGAEARRIPVGLSTSSVFPASCEEAFALAARLGYDGMEIMVWTEKATQDAATLNRLSERYGLPVLSVHAPTLLLTQYLWGADPWVKIDRSIGIARGVGAPTVVVHPPFRWQREYALGFVEGIARREAETGVRLAVENMFPWRSGMEIPAYLPDWDPTNEPYSSLCLDLSHAATAGDDFLAMLDRAGDRAVHLHLGDGLGSFKDEHLVPGRGHQPCAETLRRLAARGWGGQVVLEVNTRGGGEAGREADLAEALVFAREHLGQEPADVAHERLTVLRGGTDTARKAGKKAEKAAKRKDKRADKKPRTPERHAKTKAKSARVRAKSERAAAAKKLRKAEKAARQQKKAARREG